MIEVWLIGCVESLWWQRRVLCVSSSWRCTPTFTPLLMSTPGVLDLSNLLSVLCHCQSFNRWRCNAMLERECLKRQYFVSDLFLYLRPQKIFCRRL